MKTQTESPTTERIATIRPRVDIRETPEGVRLTAEIPGARRETLTVSVEDEVLTFSADKLPADTESSLSHREIARGRYERSFRLSRDLSREGVTAEYRNGLLKIFVPVAEHTKPRRIEVQTND